MGNWFLKNLGDAMLAQDGLDQIEALFQSTYTEAGRPNDMALFIRHESEGRLHCDVLVYFSPAASAVARAVDAKRSARPSRDGLSLFAGSEMSWPMLFPK